MCILLCRCCVRRLPADNPKFKAVYNNITADGAKLVLLLRLSPLIPFNLLNYGLGKLGIVVCLACSSKLLRLEARSSSVSQASHRLWSRVSREPLGEAQDAGVGRLHVRLPACLINLRLGMRCCNQIVAQ